MMTQALNIRAKLDELVGELKLAGLWKKQEPAWVKRYNGPDDNNQLDFFEWLQFVYLPNRLMNINVYWPGEEKTSITLQAKKIAEYGKINENILRLLIELDSL